MHEHDERRAGVVLHHERLDDGVFVDAEFPGRHARAAVLLVTIEVLGERDAGAAQHANGRRDWCALDMADLPTRLGRRDSIDTVAQDPMNRHARLPGHRRFGEPTRPSTGCRSTVLLDNVRSLYNVGAFFRTADAVRGRVDRARRHHADAGRSAASRRRPWAPSASVPWSASTMLPRRSTVCAATGIEIAAIETSLHAVDLFDWHPPFPVCVVFGHEVDGIGGARCSTAVTSTCASRRSALKSSLNVATAGGVVLYELLRKYRDLVRKLLRPAGIGLAQDMRGVGASA